MQTDTHFFFYKSALGQWHRVDFYVEGIKYIYAEQYMMAKKALLFDDINTYTKIMNATHPRDHQKLGREVKFYRQDVWDKAKCEIVYNGNFARFSQNQDQRDLLFSTKGNLVEASPIDCVWGVGLSVDNPLIKDEKNWKGQNLLGRMLTDVRDDLYEDYIKGIRY